LLQATALQGRGCSQTIGKIITMKSVMLLLALVLSVTMAAESDSVSYLNSLQTFHGAQTYRDKESGIIFYVESDGRHVAAIDRDGKLLWNRDPFVEAKLKPYRFDRPVIVSIGAPLPWMTKDRTGQFVLINFNSTQAGILSVQKGDFIFLGQD
jgi:hypothetical protein